MLGDSLCNADNKGHLCFDSFLDTCSGQWRSDRLLVNIPVSNSLYRVYMESKKVPHGTKIADAVAPVSLIASLTLANTGFPRCVSPAFFGFVPPTTLVPVPINPMISPISQRGKYRNQWPAGRGSCGSISRL